MKQVLTVVLALVIVLSFSVVGLANIDDAVRYYQDLPAHVINSSFSEDVEELDGRPVGRLLLYSVSGKFYLVHNLLLSPGTHYFSILVMNDNGDIIDTVEYNQPVSINVGPDDFTLVSEFNWNGSPNTQYAFFGLVDNYQNEDYLVDFVAAMVD